LFGLYCMHTCVVCVWFVSTNIDWRVTNLHAHIHKHMHTKHGLLIVSLKLETAVWSREPRPVLVISTQHSTRWDIQLEINYSSSRDEFHPMIRLLFDSLHPGDAYTPVNWRNCLIYITSASTVTFSKRIYSKHGLLLSILALYPTTVVVSVAWSLSWCDLHGRTIFTETERKGSFLNTPVGWWCNLVIGTSNPGKV